MDEVSSDTAGKRDRTGSGGDVDNIGGTVKTMLRFIAVCASPRRMKPAFREKIMLSISRMNECRY